MSSVNYRAPAASADYTEDRKHSSDVENSLPSDDIKEKEEHDPSALAATHVNFYDDAESEIVMNNGVRKVEAAQAVWSKKTRWILFTGLTMAVYIYSLDGVTTYQYLFYATSNANNHAMTGTVTTAAAIIIAVGRPLMAKFADTLGRAETYCIVTLLYMLGYVLLGSSNTIGQISGGTIVYSIGYSGLDLLTTIIVADATTLRWRGLINGVMSMPYVINCFISAEIVDALIPGKWRMGYFMFVILVPVCLGPVIGILLWSQNKAKKLELLRPVEEFTAKKPLQTIKNFLSEMDVIGLVLVGASLALILIPLGIAGRTASVEGWKDPGTIVMICLGVALFPVLCVWEWKYAAYPLAPKRFFKNRNIVASLTITWIDFISFYIVYTYQYSFISLVKTGVWSERSLSYFSNTMTLALCIFSVPCGAYMAWTRRYKWLTVAGLLIRLLGVGVMIKSRSAHGTDFELVACQLLQGLGGAIAAITCGIASQAGVTHADVGTVTALILLFSGIGNAFGSTVATAIWTNYYEDALVSNLPQLNMTEIAAYYASPASAVLLAYDDPIRVGITNAVSGIMKTMCIIATVVAIFPPLIAAFVMEDLELGDVQNTVDMKDLAGNKVESLGKRDVKAAAETERV